MISAVICKLLIYIFLVVLDPSAINARMHTHTLVFLRKISRRAHSSYPPGDVIISIE